MAFQYRPSAPARRPAWIRRPGRRHTRPVRTRPRDRVSAEGTSKPAHSGSRGDAEPALIASARPHHPQEVPCYPGSFAPPRSASPPQRSSSARPRARRAAKRPRPRTTRRSRCVSPTTACLLRHRAGPAGLRQGARMVRRQARRQALLPAPASFRLRRQEWIRARGTRRRRRAARWFRRRPLADPRHGAAPEPWFLVGRTEGLGGRVAAGNSPARAVLRTSNHECSRCC